MYCGRCLRVILALLCASCSSSCASKPPPATSPGPKLDASTKPADADGGDADTAPSSPAQPATAPQGAPLAISHGSRGCGKRPVSFTGRHAAKLTVAGKQRDYEVWVPSRFDNGTPLPLVFVFHESGGTIQSAVSYGLQRAAGALDQAIYVFPQALSFGQYGVGWDPSCSGADVQLVQQIRGELEDSFCTAPDRVFATGFSWGGDFANTLGCCPGTTFRAVASASGAEWGPEVKVNADCGSNGAAAYRLTYGSADGSYPSAQFDAVIGLYRKALACRPDPLPAAPLPCVAYQGCAAPMIVCKYAGLGHNLPSGWADDTWHFFESFAARAGN